MSIFYACMYCNHAVQYPQRPRRSLELGLQTVYHHVGAGSRTQQVLSTAEPFLQPLASFSLLTPSVDRLLDCFHLLAAVNKVMVSKYLSPCFQLYWINSFFKKRGILCLLPIYCALNVLLHCGSLDERCPPSAFRETHLKQQASPPHLHPLSALLSRFIFSEASFYSTDTLGVLAADTGKQRRSDMTSALKDLQRPVWPDQTKAGATRTPCPSVCCDWRPEQGSWNQTGLWNILDAAATAEAPGIEVTQETRSRGWLGSRQCGISSFSPSPPPFLCVHLPGDAHAMHTCGAQRKTSDASPWVPSFHLLIFETSATDLQLCPADHTSGAPRFQGSLCLLSHHCWDHRHKPLHSGFWFFFKCGF